MPSFFFLESQLSTVLLLMCESYMSWSTSFISLNLCVGFSIIDSILFLLKSALVIRKKVRQQVFAVDICQFEGISMGKI